MKIASAITIATLLTSLIGTGSAGHVSAGTAPANTLICGSDDHYPVRRLNSNKQDEFCTAYQGKVILVVNTASRCAFTEQYAGLEKLYDRYRHRGLVVTGFPSNDFANQEPDNEQKIKDFCRMTYGVQFPMYAKTRVTGADAAPLYRALTDASGTQPRWNFHKYLIDRGGRLIRSFSADTPPESDELIDAIEQLL